MNYTLDEIFEQAESDNFSAKINGRGYRSVILYGIKIIKDDKSGHVEILNIRNTYGYYHRTTEEELLKFHHKGWKYGVYHASLQSHSERLLMVRNEIRRETMGANKKKVIDALNKVKLHTVKRYIEIKHKLEFI